ncbi:MAG: hypothetical protein FWH04_03965 [Oscillospiraceae bacterium]|nr:hypothetical protein [Oscillospiraceae bacterium]
MSQGFIRGSDPRTLIKSIGDFLDPKYIGKRKNGYNSCARRLILTESAYFASKATHDAYHSQGVKMFQFLATLDEKTCPICGGLESSEANQKGLKNSVMTFYRIRGRNLKRPEGKKIVLDMNGTNVVTFI